jgi:hypothetical protein
MQVTQMPSLKKRICMTVMVIEYQALKAYGGWKVTFHTSITSLLVGNGRSGLLSESVFSFWRKNFDIYVYYVEKTL